MIKLVIVESLGTKKYN